MHAIPDFYTPTSGLPQISVLGVRHHIVRFGYFVFFAGRGTKYSLKDSSAVRGGATHVL